MEHQQSELEQTNAHLEEQTQQLEYQREQLLRAQGALTDKARELELASQYKSEFLANMSHELRTPLNSTLILAKLLADNRPGNLQAEQIKYAQTIHAAGSDLLALINDILDLSKIEAGQVTVSAEPVTIATALQTLMEPLRPIAREKGLELAWTVDPGVPASMNTDPMRLAQVLKNLLSNALKFTAKGSVGLHVSSAPQGMLSFAVRDTGIGIGEEQQQFIFDAFRQADGSTHRKFGGTGLGLSISRDLAGLLGGTLTVSSTPGQGSVFTLTVPVDLEPAEPARGGAAASAPAVARQAAAPAAPPVSVPAVATANVAPAAPAFAPAMSPAMASSTAVVDALRKGGHGGSGRRILVIEDDLRFADILAELAREMDFECDVANTASDGLALAASQQPNAIVLDINLPDFSGLGVLDQLKRNPVTRHIPVHVVSVADYSQEAMGRGAVGYALKPVKREELVHALQRLEAKFTQDLRRVLVVEDDVRRHGGGGAGASARLHLRLHGDGPEPARHQRLRTAAAHDGPGRGVLSPRDRLYGPGAVARRGAAVAALFQVHHHQGRTFARAPARRGHAVPAPGGVRAVGGAPPDAAAGTQPGICAGRAHGAGGGG
jgi:signal transduction histidine kinase/CheY-like chemotaxis protein